jgi:hypothetical protein
LNSRIHFNGIPLTGATIDTAPALAAYSASVHGKIESPFNAITNGDQMPERHTCTKSESGPKLDAD